MPHELTLPGSLGAAADRQRQWKEGAHLIVEVDSVGGSLRKVLLCLKSCLPWYHLAVSQERNQSTGLIMAAPKPWVDMPGLRKMSWRKMSAIGGALALPVLVLGGMLLLGLPVLLIGGPLLLLTSPCTCAVGCCTAPIWIPLLLFVGIPMLIFFVTTGGIMLLLTVMAALTGAAGWWIYRYNRGPMPPGGQTVQSLLDRVRGRSREVIWKVRQ